MPNKLPCLVVAGPSGVGKGTIIKHLKHNHPGVFGFSVSHATRKPRPGEIDGLHYNFVTVEEFEKLIAENAFLEYAKVHGNYYGTSYAAIQSVVDEGRLCILDIDVQGSRSARKKGIVGTYIFVSPPSLEELERRLRGRGSESEEAIVKRMATTAFEMAATDEIVNGKPLFDTIICNDVLDETVQVFEDLLKDNIRIVKEALAAKEAAEAAAADSGGASKAEDAEAAKSKTVSEQVSVGWMVSPKRALAIAGALLVFGLAARYLSNREKETTTEKK